MFAVSVTLLLIAAEPAAGTSAAQRLASQAPSKSDLAAAVRASDYAEIYIIPPWISFAVAPTPSTVRLSGCKFFVSRHAVNGATPEWRELERGLAGIKIEPAPSSRRRSVYFGLVLGDEKGTLREIYADHMSDPPGKVLALDQRHQVHISERFSAALFAFAARHPELAQGPPVRCERLDVPWPPKR